MLRPVVIGSGHAGTAAARELVRLGFRPIVVDVGREADRSPGHAARRCVEGPPLHDPSTPDRAVASGPPADQVPWSLRFGSPHAYAPDDDEQLPTVRADPRAPVASLARGGLSNVWSGAVLPAHDADMAGWPITRADLAPHYRRVLDAVDLCGDEGPLDAEFPIFRSDVGRLPLPPNAQRALDRLQAAAPRVQGRSVLTGSARLAIRADREGLSTCRSCDRCHDVCAHGAIDAAGPHLDRLAAAGSVDYRPGLVVRSVEETEDHVVVHCQREGGGREEVRASRVFVAAGAIGSTRIVLESLGLWDTPLRLATTQGFLMPVLAGRSGQAEPPALAVPSFFVELRVDPSPHWVHVQVAPPKPLVVGGMLRRALGRHLGDHALRWSTAHLLVAMCSLDSSAAGHHLLTLSRPDRGGPPLLRIDTVASAGFPARARRVGREIHRAFRQAGMVALPPWGPLAPSEPYSWHVGSTLPMRARPVEAWDTDVLGRPRGFARTHVVDAAVLPSVPATSVTLPSMANATRIVNAAMGG